MVWLFFTQLSIHSHEFVLRRNPVLDYAHVSVHILLIPPTAHQMKYMFGWWFVVWLPCKLVQIYSHTLTRRSENVWMIFENNLNRIFIFPFFQSLIANTCRSALIVPINASTCMKFGIFCKIIIPNLYISAHFYWTKLNVFKLLFLTF